MVDSDPLTFTQRAEALLDEVATRGDVKRAALWLERNGSSQMVRAIIAVARKRGTELPPEAETWPAKKLIRKARGREEGARIRQNPIRRDESFQCQFCGLAVKAHGRTARNHCPSCLTSKHVDNIPGDRQASCGGLMPTQRIESQKGEFYLVQQCERCGHVRRNRAILDGETSDNWEMITRLTARDAP